MSAATPTIGQVATILDGLRTVNDARAREQGRKLVRGLRRSFPDRSFSPTTTDSIRSFEEEAAPFEELDLADGKVRRLEREIESTKAETRRLRRARCEGVVDRAIGRGIVPKRDREALVRELEAGDVNLASALDPFFRLSRKQLDDYGRQLEAELGLEPLPAPPQDAVEAQRLELAAVFGLKPEDL